LKHFIVYFYRLGSTFLDLLRGYTSQNATRLLYIYTWDSRTPLYTQTSFVFILHKINYMWYMNYFSSEDLDCVCFIEEETNNVVIKFFGMPNHDSAQLFTSYIMMRLGFEYTPFGEENYSKLVH